METWSDCFSRQLPGLVGLALVALWLSACGDDVEEGAQCGPGTVFVDGLCVPDRRGPEPGVSGGGASASPASSRSAGSAPTIGPETAPGGNGETSGASSDPASFVPVPSDGPGTCDPGRTRTCLSFEEVGICNEAGTGFDLLEVCEDGSCIAPGVCADGCVENAKLPSNLGCEYWAADLPQDRGATQGGDGQGGAEAQDWAVVVSNPQFSEVLVSIYAASDLSTAIITESVPSRSLAIIRMPRADLYATSKTRRSFRILSNQPVAMHQFNPLDNVAVQSNDASLLLPINALSGSYRLLSYRARFSWYVSATVIAVADGQTTVTVVAPDRINSPEGDERGEDGVMDGWDDRDPRTFTLEQGEVLNLSTRGGTDITGLQVDADQPVALFSSAAGLYVPYTSGFSDHVEQQMLPMEAWRDRYVGVPFRQRGSVRDHFRVQAGDTATTVTLSIPVNGQGWANGEITLQPNRWTEFAADQPFELSATNPVSVAQFMAGGQAEGVPQTCVSSGGPSVGLGDPALTILVPSEQWRSDYIVHTPNNYQEDWFTLYGPIDLEVSVRAEPSRETIRVTLDQPIPGTTLGYAHYALPRGPTGNTTRDNVHQLTAVQPFGAQVYGWSCAVSYAYPAGLNLDGVDSPFVE